MPFAVGDRRERVTPIGACGGNRTKAFGLYSGWNGSPGSFLSSGVSGFKLSCRQITVGSVWTCRATAQLQREPLT